MFKCCIFTLVATSVASSVVNVDTDGKTTDPPPPYPGPDFVHPKIHTSPDCLHEGGWHDMAASFTFNNKHHAFQGCPSAGGWSHSISDDLVHWTDLGIGVHTIHETYEGMDSSDTPCSGFVTVDDDGVPCAGFRQCSSGAGTTGLNPAAQKWDVPMELRCATDPASDLTDWSEPKWIYPVYFYRPLPYDPVRPWKDFDGKWYSAFSTDGCNATTKKVPCAAGGQLELLVSAGLHGEKADWKLLEPMFTTNTTKSGARVRSGSITHEFVTAGYFGGLPGDPMGGKTRVVMQNNPRPTFWVGQQANGSKFTAYWDKVGAVGHYDYGALTMARTLGGHPNQVTTNDRKVLIGWISGPDHYFGSVSQSLGRDLSLSANFELLQAFIPELKVLRMSETKHMTTVAIDGVGGSVPHGDGSLQLEVVASFSWTGANPKTAFGVSVLNGTLVIAVDCTGDNDQAPGGCMVTQTSNTTNNYGPLLPLGSKTVHVHAIVDGEILETIVNNRTALVTYGVPPNADATAIHIFGVGASAGVEGNITTWSLKQANNWGTPALRG